MKKNRLNLTDKRYGNCTLPVNLLCSDGLIQILMKCQEMIISLHEKGERLEKKKGYFLFIE
jgi:hypothetical protein